MAQTANRESSVSRHARVPQSETEAAIKTVKLTLDHQQGPKPPPTSATYRQSIHRTHHKDAVTEPPAYLFICTIMSKSTDDKPNPSPKGPHRISKPSNLAKALRNFQLRRSHRHPTTASRPVGEALSTVHQHNAQVLSDRLTLFFRTFCERQVRSAACGAVWRLWLASSRGGAVRGGRILGGAGTLRRTRSPPPGARCAMRGPDASTGIRGRGRRAPTSGSRARWPRAGRSPPPP